MHGRDIARPALLIGKLPNDLIARQVAAALAEDLGGGDVTAALVPAQQQVRAQIIAREAQSSAARTGPTKLSANSIPASRCEWQAADGERIAANQTVLKLSGAARPILSGERTALNFLQTLSATATAANRYVEAVAGTGCRILDTRKTIPGLRLAQKYAARCGGAQNHRLGLHDMVLIKENHIIAAGSIADGNLHGAPNFPRHTGRSRGGVTRRIRPGAGRRRRHHHAR